MRTRLRKLSMDRAQVSGPSVWYTDRGPGVSGPGVGYTDRVQVSQVSRTSVGFKNQGELLTENGTNNEP